MSVLDIDHNIMQMLETCSMASYGMQMTVFEEKQ